MALSGRCMCGAVTVTATPTARGLNLCHCDDCRRWVGVGWLSLEAAADDARLEGAVTRRQTSPWAERGWCKDCGAAILYRPTGDSPEPKIYFSAGLFPDAGGLPLETEFYVDAQPQAYAVTGAAQRLTRAETIALLAPEEDTP